MFDKLCASCNVCTFMPRQEISRVLVLHDDDKPKVLVIDDVNSYARAALGLRVSTMLLGECEYAYTQSVRCLHEDDYPFTEEEREAAVACCSTWTNSLLEGRKFIVTTLQGAKQLKLTSLVEEGDLCHDSRYGFVLIIPPLHTFVKPDGEKLHKEMFATYKAKIWRVLKKEEAHA